MKYHESHSRTIEYRIRQNIKLANGQTRSENIGQGLDTDSCERLILLRDKYLKNGFDVELVKITQETTVEVIDA